MVEADHPELSIAQQCAILGISRSTYYYQPKEAPEDPDLVILEAILEVLKEKPFYGYRRMAKELAYLHATRKQIRRIMKKAGLRAIYPGLQLSKPAKGSKKYPYLLRGMNIWLPNQVWATDITYIKLSGGYVYLVAIIDLYSRKILSWQVSNTMDAQFCVSALEEALAKYGVPGIFNTDQGSQFTSDAFVSVLESHGIQISMDGVNRALDNIRVERFWRSLKYEDLYIKDYRTMTELKTGLARYIKFYNSERFHQSLEYETPDVIYESKFQDRELKVAA
jgi:putative transposase